MTNEWNYDTENLLTTEDVQYNKDDKNGEIIQEQPPSVFGTFHMIWKVRLQIWQ